MTEEIFHRDAYIRNFDAQVIDSNETGLVLDRTAFYPGGGGQPCDTGILECEGHPFVVHSTVRQHGEIWHIVEGPLPSGLNRIQGFLDWNRRYALMRTHTALHIVSGVIWNEYGAHVTGGNMTPLTGRMDFELGHISGDFAANVENLANREIERDRIITVSFLPRKEALAIPDLIRTRIDLLPVDITKIRVVTIEGLDVQADGGTHVGRTGDVGRIRVVGHESKGRINKRLRLAIEDRQAQD